MRYQKRLKTFEAKQFKGNGDHIEFIEWLREQGFEALWAPPIRDMGESIMVRVFGTPRTDRFIHPGRVTVMEEDVEAGFPFKVMSKNLSEEVYELADAD